MLFLTALSAVHGTISADWTIQPKILKLIENGDNHVCGVDQSNTVFCSDNRNLPASVSWFQVPGKMSWLDARGGSIIGTNAYNQIWVTDSITPTANVVFVPNLSLRQVSSDGAVTCGVTTADDTYCADKLTATGLNWFPIGKKLRHVSVKDHVLYGVDSIMGIWRIDFTGAPSTAPQVTALVGTLKQIDYDGTTVCGVDPYNLVYCMNSIVGNSPNWQFVPKITATYVSVKGSLLTAIRTDGFFSSALFSFDPIGISYNVGAPVLTGPLSVYVIYYGAFTATQKSVVENFVSGVGSSAWWNIQNKYYYQQSTFTPKVYVGDSVVLKGTVTDKYSLGKSLSASAAPTLIQANIDANRIPEDTNAVYIVLIAGDVQHSMPGPTVFCKDYCGNHNSATLRSGKTIVYAFSGMPTACVNTCVPALNRAVSPNNDIPLSGMVSAMAHELVEAVSNPQPNNFGAWVDSATGYENGDKCAVH
jgi:hypothetical protein